MRPEKQLLMDEVKGKISNSKSLFLTKYQKLGANKTADFRQMIAQSGGDFEVVKKRILLKAAKDEGISLDLDMLEGHIGVVFSGSDPVPVTKALFQFAKENEETIEILCGRFDGQLCSAKDVKMISELPSKDEMRAQLLGTLEAPQSQTLAVMDALLTSLLYCLENKNETAT